MELWIRNQEKSLGKVSFIRYAGLALDITYECGKVTAEHFKTNERALEVLDEIQNLIKPTLINTEYKSIIKQGLNNLEFDVVMEPVEDKIQYIQPNVVVYEMPKE